jgi:YgiT-type zinc finger domain-containing protein
MDPNDEENSPQIQGLCSECQTGLLHRQYVTYFTWLNDELITVPDFPAWVCDVCGRREYDGRAILRLNTLLNHEAGRRPKVPHKPRKKGPDRPSPARTR